MPLYLTEEDVDSLLTMNETVAQIRKGFQLQAEGGVHSLPRSRIKTGKGTLNLLPAALDSEGISGLKAYYGNGRDSSFLVIVFSVEDTRPVCVIEARRLGQLRTGAVTGVMTEQLSRKDASVMGCLGAGYQAETQIEAVSLVRNLDTVIVKGRTAESTARFVSLIKSKYGLNAEGASSNADFTACDILATATNSRSPVIEDGNVPMDCHINAIGANRIQSSELETATFASARIIAVDSKEQAMIESGDLVNALKAGKLSEEDITEAWQVMAGKAVTNRNATSERTIFKSLGIGMEDLITAKHVYNLARKKGVGTTI